jgi:hypothetical protein
LGSDFEPIDVKSDEDLIAECIQDFNHYRDYIAVIIALREVILEDKEFGRFGGPEVHVKVDSNEDSSECTPDALIDLGEKRVICVEIKTGDGGNSEAIVSEVNRALRYYAAKSWRTGVRKQLINSSDVFIICTRNYWSKLKILLESDYAGIGGLLRKDGVSVLTWEYHKSKIRIQRMLGNCRHQKLETLLKSSALVPTDNAVLVEHSKFLFTPMEPPPVYTAVMFLTVILPPRKMLELSIAEIHKHARDYALRPTREGDRDQIRSSWTRKAMEVLEKCNYAKRKNGKFTIGTPQRATKESLTKRICAKIHKVKKKKDKKPKLELADDQSLLPDFF